MPGGLVISSCDSLFISTAKSHYGLYVISLLLKLMSLASVSLREIREKISDSTEQSLKNNLYNYVPLELHSVPKYAIGYPRETKLIG